MSPAALALVRTSRAGLSPAGLAQRLALRLQAIGPAHLRDRWTAEAAGEAVTHLLGDLLDADTPAARADLRVHARRRFSPRATAADFAAIGAALMLALADELGDGLDAELRGAWAEAYGDLAATLQDRAFAWAA